MSTTDDPRFTELVSRYLDGSLSREQESQLLEFLQEPRCQERFLELTRLQSEIAGLLAGPVADDTMVALVLQDVSRGVAEEAVAEPLIPLPNPPGGAASRRPRRLAFSRWLWRLATVAAAVLLIAGFLRLQRSWFGSPPAAQLTRTWEKVFVFGDDGCWRPAQAGQEVRAGQGIVTVGEASGADVQYADGSRLELGPNTTLTQVADAAHGRFRDEPDKRVVLTQGVLKVSAVEQPEGHPMVVRTPHAEVVVRGTRFTLESESDATALTVSRGMVQFARRDSNQSIEVGPGCFAVAEPGTDTEQFASKPAPDPPDVVEINLNRGIQLGHKGGWSALVFAPDNSALAGGMLVEGVVRLWQMGDGHPKAPTEFAGFNKGLWSVAFSPDGRTLAAAGSVDQAVRLWDVQSRRELATLPHKNDARAAAFSPDGRTLATGSHDSTVRLWEPTTGAERAVFQENDRGGWAGVYSLAFSPDGQRLAVGLSDRRVRVHGIPSGKALFTRKGHTNFVLSVAFSPGGDLLATASDNEVIVWDTATLAERYRLAASAPVAFSPDGGLLATGGVAAPALWEAATGRKRARFRGHYAKVYTFAFSPDGKWLAVGDWRNITLLQNTDLEGASWGGPLAPSK